MTRSTSVEFCDTNILVYAYQVADDLRRARAIELVDRLGDASEGAVSIQVLQELFVTLTRRAEGPAPRERARLIITALAGGWLIFQPASADVLAAIDATARWQVSFWDAMIVVAAQRSGATVLWSEDLSHGQRYDDLEVRNPFR